MMRWIEKQFAKVVQGYQFISYVLYYWMGSATQPGKKFSDAVEAAHMVVRK